MDDACTFQYPALPQYIRDRHGVDMFSSTGPIVRKDLVRRLDDAMLSLCTEK